MLLVDGIVTVCQIANYKYLNRILRHCLVNVLYCMHNPSFAEGRPRSYRAYVSRQSLANICVGVFGAEPRHLVLKQVIKADALLRLLRCADPQRQNIILVDSGITYFEWPDGLVTRPGSLTTGMFFEPVPPRPWVQARQEEPISWCFGRQMRYMPGENRVPKPKQLNHSKTQFGK